MSKWALIVGIDVYDVDRFRLEGAVNDALAFLDWCVKPEGGGVPPGNVNLLLDSVPENVDTSRLPPGVVAQSAIRDNFTLSVGNLLTRSNSSGDRFFFYFAGHGITARVNGADVPCICLRNFRPELTSNAVSLPSVFERFRATRFKEQYFFVDACRNLPFTSEFQVSDFDRPVTPIENPFPQFVAYATQPRNTAAEIQSPDSEGGAFTGALLAGLAGQRAAKLWDAEQGQYIVRWNRLFKFVEQSVMAMRLRSPFTANSSLIQAPKQYGERGSEDPVLATFAEDAFAHEDLSVDFTPAEVCSEVSLTLSEMGVPNRDFPAPLSVPWKTQLRPRIYALVATAARYRSKLKIVELFESQTLNMEMVSAPPGPATAPADANIRVASRGIDRGLESAFAATEVEAVEALPMGIASPDPLAQLEIADASGRVLAVGRGQVYLPSTVGRGFFRARIVDPDGAFDERLVEMSPTGPGPLAQIAPSPTPLTPAVQWAMRRANIEQSADGLLMPSQAIGPAAFMKFSTLLALAAGARAEGGENGRRLRSVPLPPCDLPGTFDANMGGLLVLAGDELLRTDWSGSRVSVSTLLAPDTSSTLRVKPSPDTASVAGADAVLAPGVYWLSFDAPGIVVGTIAVSVLPNRITLVVVTREVDRNRDLHQYSLWLPSTTEPNLRYLDPQYQGAHFAAIRRIELMQRTYVRGRTSPSIPDIDALLYDKWIDPIAGCLGGYMLMRMGRAAELDIPSVNLSSHFGSLPDSWVLRAACFEDHGSPSDVCAAVRNALDRGLPIFAQGVRKLAQLAKTWASDHPRTSLLVSLAAKCPEGGIFTAFSQEEESATCVGCEANFSAAAH